eukprot:3823978-Alexandrium_andersonii.AAC.1
MEALMGATSDLESSEVVAGFAVQAVLKKVPEEALQALDLLGTVCVHSSEFKDWCGQQQPPVQVLCNLANKSTIRAWQLVLFFKVLVASAGMQYSSKQSASETTQKPYIGVACRHELGHKAQCLRSVLCAIP